MALRQEFRLKSDEAYRRGAAHEPADADAGFELELQNGVLNLVFEELRNEVRRV
jgi:hypothetical protein